MSFLWLFEIHSVLLLSVVALLVASKIYPLVLILAIVFLCAISTQYYSFQANFSMNMLS